METRATFLGRIEREILLLEMMITEQVGQIDHMERGGDQESVAAGRVFLRELERAARLAWDCRLILLW